MPDDSTELNRTHERPPQPQNNRRRNRPSSRARLYAFRLIALSLPFAALVLANCIFYWLDIGTGTDLVLRLPDSASPGWHAFNQDVDTAYWDSVDLNGPESRPFLLPKPPGTFRIVIAGASTVEGYPWPTELAFSRQIELILQQQLTGRTVEVLNAGIVGITSFGVLDIVRQSIECDPDLIVVYCGHNEFYGPGGVSSTSSSASRLAYSTMTTLRRYRLPQVFMRSLQPEPDPTHGLAQLLTRDRAVPFDGPAFTTARAWYRANLEGMASVGRKNDVPVVFCSVACNLRDQSPIQSISSTTLLPKDAVARDQLLESARTMVEGGRFAEALELVEKAERLDETYALAAYRRAQCLDGLGKPELAAKAYSDARDLDGCRFRAPGSFGRIVRETAEKNGMVFVDIEGLMAQRSDIGAPGHESFLEHIHFNQEASWCVAGAIARAITEEIADQTWNQNRVPTAEERDELFGLLEQDHLVAITQACLLLEEPPFNAASDVEQHLKALGGQFDDHINRIPEADRRIFLQLGLTAQSDDLLPSTSRALYSTGRFQECVDLLRRNIRRRPWDPDRHLLLARCLTDLHRPDQAVDVLNAGIEQVCGGWKHRLQGPKLRLERLRRTSQSSVSSEYVPNLQGPRRE